MNDTLQEQLQYLRLTRLAEHWENDLKEAARQQRLKRARLHETWTMETFPFERQPKLNRKQIMALYDTMDFIPKAQNMIWLGRTGCGKTGLASSFIVKAVQLGYTARNVLFAELMTELHRSAADRSEAKALKRYLSCDILLIDELGYIETDPVQVALFFTLMQRRHKKKPTFITSNLGFSDWGKFLKNDHLTAALIDRLTEASHVINMKDCVSLRTKLATET